MFFLQTIALILPGACVQAKLVILFKIPCRVLCWRQVRHCYWDDHKMTSPRPDCDCDCDHRTAALCSALQAVHAVLGPSAQALVLAFTSHCPAAGSGISLLRMLTQHRFRPLFPKGYLLKRPPGSSYIYIYIYMSLAFFGFFPHSRSSETPQTFATPPNQGAVASAAPR